MIPNGNISAIAYMFQIDYNKRVLKNSQDKFKKKIYMFTTSKLVSFLYYTWEFINDAEYYTCAITYECS